MNARVLYETTDSGTSRPASLRSSAAKELSAAVDAGAGAGWWGSGPWTFACTTACLPRKPGEQNSHCKARGPGRTHLGSGPRAAPEPRPVRPGRPRSPRPRHSQLRGAPSAAGGGGEDDAVGAGGRPTAASPAAGGLPPETPSAPEQARCGLGGPGGPGARRCRRGGGGGPARSLPPQPRAGSSLSAAARAPSDPTKIAATAPATRASPPPLTLAALSGSLARSPRPGSPRLRGGGEQAARGGGWGGGGEAGLAGRKRGARARARGALEGAGVF